MKKPNVLVLEGGSSNEREISFRSAEAVVVGLKKSDFTVTRFDTKSGFGGILSKETEVVFPILHGAAGEDGSVQRFLEDHNLSFLGSSSESSKLCFDKSAFKKLMKQSGILTPNWEIANINYLDNSELVDNPFVLKPISGGSSIDTYIVRHAEDMKNIPKDIFDSYPEMLLEKLILGAEITVPVLDGKALPVIEIIPPENEEFDYDNKYNGKTRELCPAINVAGDVQIKAQKLAETVHSLTGARHLSRIDIMVTPDEDLYVLELNTIPGLTEQSLFPKAAQSAGISMPDLVKRFYEMVVRDYSLD